MLVVTLPMHRRGITVWKLNIWARRFSSAFWARFRTTACVQIMSRCWQEQGSCNPSFGSSIRDCKATLHGSEYWNALVRSEVIRYWLVRTVNSCLICFAGTAGTLHAWKWKAVSALCVSASVLNIKSIFLDTLTQRFFCWDNEYR